MQVIRKAAHFLGLPTYLTSREVERLKLKTTPIVWRYEDAPEASYFDGFKPSPATRIEFLKLSAGEMMRTMNISQSLSTTPN